MPGARGMMTCLSTIRAPSRGVQRTRAAIGDQREIAGVEAAFGRDPAHHVRHLRGGDAQDAVRSLDRIEAERLCDLFVESLFRRGADRASSRRRGSGRRRAGRAPDWSR